jgi:hypothetical protein
VLSERVRRVTRRFAEVVCPSGMRAHHRTDRVLAEFELMLGARREARRALAVRTLTDQAGARPRDQRLPTHPVVRASSVAYPAGPDVAAAMPGE